MAQTQTWETKTNWAMEKLIPKELAKNHQITMKEKNDQIWGYPKVENCKKVLKPNLNKETEVPKSTKQKWINKLGCGIILTKLIPKKMAAPKN